MSTDPRSWRATRRMARKRAIAESAELRKTETLHATVAERSGWHTGYAKGVDPRSFELYAGADTPIDTVIAERVAQSADGKTTVHATFVIRDDSYSARRRKGIDTRKGINLTDGKSGKVYRVQQDGTKVPVSNRSGKVSAHGNADGMLD